MQRRVFIDNRPPGAEVRTELAVQGPRVSDEPSHSGGTSVALVICRTRECRTVSWPSVCGARCDGGTPGHFMIHRLEPARELRASTARRRGRPERDTRTRTAQ